MREELSVILDCCQNDAKVSIHVPGVLARNPNDVKQNVLCSRCDKLVILSFERTGTQTLVVEQEVIDL